MYAPYISFFDRSLGMNQSKKSSRNLLPRVAKTALSHWDTIAFLLVITVASFILRYLNFGFESADYKYFLVKWYDQIDAAGGLAGIGQVYGNYAPTYMYLMAIMTYLPVSPLVAIKLFSIVFDYLLAVYVALLVRHLTGKDTPAIMAYTATLFLPNVFINGAIWGQCDAMFTAFLVMSLYYMLKDKSIASMVFFGVAFSFKLQAIFFLPVIILALCKKKLKWYSPLFAVAVFLLAGLPAVIAGMSPADAYGVYFVQAGYYSDLTLNGPNLYAAIHQLKTYKLYEGFADSLVFFAFGAVGCAMWPIYRSKRKSIDGEGWLLMALFFAAFMPYVLPHMHERYWFFSDVLALIWVFCRPKQWYVSLLLILPSLYASAIYLFGTDHTILAYAAVVMLMGICLVGKALWEALRECGSEDTAHEPEP